MKVASKIKRGCCVRHEHYGPLYVTGSFRDGTGTVWCGINGKDGVDYQFMPCEAEVISRDTFDAEMR